MPNPFISLQVTVSESNQPPKFLQRMEESEFRVLIKHYFLRGKTLPETKAKLDKYYSDFAPSYEMFQKWLSNFVVFVRVQKPFQF